MGALIEDQFAQRRGGRPDQGGILADTLDGPAGIAPVAGGHVLRDRGVLVVAAHALMRGDPFAPVENLDGAGGEADLDLGADEAMRDAVVVRLDLDMIVDADPTDPPLREHVRAPRQGLQRRPVDLLQQLAAGDAEPPDRPFLVEPGHQLGERRIDLGEAVEDAVAQPPEQPALDHQHRLLDLRLVARPSRPGRQNGGAVMRRQVGVTAVDLRIVQAGLDHRDLGVVRHQ